MRSHERLQNENAALRAASARHQRRVRELDEQLLEANRRRQEAAKRLDELISQLDHLEAEFSASPGAEG